MSQFKQRAEMNKTNDSWTDNYDEIVNDKSVHTNQLKTFTPVNTLLKKQEVINVPVHSSSFKKDQHNEHPQHANRPIITIPSRDGENTPLNLPGAPQTPHMLQSNQAIQRSTTINNSQLQEQANAYLKEIDAKNQNKHFQQKEELDNFKYLSIIYNVNTIVNKDFAGQVKHSTIQKDIYNASIEGLRLQNRLAFSKPPINLPMQPPVKVVQPQIDKPYKNKLTSLCIDKSPKHQLLVVEFVNMGLVNNQNLDKNGFISNSGAAGVISSIQNGQNTLGQSQKIQDPNNFLQNFKAFPTLYHLNFDTNRDPCPFIAFDKMQGRHFVYNNDDKIMVFSHEPISNPLNDKSKPLLYMSLDDKLDDILAQKGMGGQQDIVDSQQNPLTSGLLGIAGRARVNPTLQIITDQRGKCSALLVIGGYIDLGNGSIQPKTNIKVFKIGKRQIDIKPAFQIQMKHPRVNPIVMRVKQSHCKDAKVSQTEDKKFLLLLGGANPELENRRIQIDTNTCCSVIEYENIFKQLERMDTTSLEISQTLKVFYNDQEAGRNLEKIASYLSKGVFIHQKSKKNLDMHNKMFIMTEKKKQLLNVHSISLSENFVNIFETNIDVKIENQWSYSNTCTIDNFILCISPQQYNPTIIDTNNKNCKQMNTEEVIEFNSKKQEFFDAIKPKQSKTSCSCNIY